ncbi:MAG: ATP-dependent DNA helicase RecG [Lachnospiraceae bacterium]|nr:ATP-dependent DNA helicase RecG [Lachnospiraceae bacterium]
MELTALKGIGSKTEEYFKKLGVHSQEELLEFFPRDYELFFPPVTVGEIGYKTFAAVRGVFTQDLFQRRVKKMTITTAQFKDEIGKTIKVTWFNAPFMKDAVHPGQLYILRGRVSRKYGVLQLNQPKVYTPEEYAKKMNSMQPVYPLTKGLSSNLIAGAVRQAIEGDAFAKLDKEDPIPGEVRVKYGLCKKSYAVSNLHFPESKEAYMAGAVRMSFEEIFLFILSMKRNESDQKTVSEVRISNCEQTQAFLKQLPFSLTEAQKRVIGEINTDMMSGFVMNRLIQGDVGSGKTIVALAALMNAAYSGYQGALMAPTEVLASQHYENITRMFKENGIDLNVALLTGSMTALEKRVVYDALESGRIHIIVGTHALFQEKAIYHNLGLVVTDEQHRFGIKQREALAKKAADGVQPHMIVMSATPIPRTLALIIYGNMDVSVIDQLPGGRKPIKNAVVDDSYKEQAYRFIEKEVAKGHQVYIICPLVEYSEGLDAQNVTDYTEMLRDVLDEQISIGMLHGQMPNAKKNEIMTRFAEGKIQVLVSTTVVEVGVDVPNATVMMVEDANRFGLAALHQLRGRVGRGGNQSYCIFVCNNHSKEAMERLEILKTSNDGFEIASKDLEMRGPGEFTGIRQSGALSFKNFDIYRDADIAQKAIEAVNDYLSGRLRLTKSEEELLLERTSLEAGAVLL